MINLSQLARTVACLGSVALISEHGIAWVDNEAADEGTNAHAVAERMLLGEIVPEEENSTLEMIEAAQVYVDYVRSVVSPDCYLHIEAKMGAPGISGRIDLYTYNKDTNTFDLFDFKYGHAYVDEFENYQLVGSALVVLENCNYEENPTVNLHIVQPRCFQAQSSRVWKTTAARLAPYFKRISETAKAIDSGEVQQCRVSTHCHKCPAAHVCESLAVASSYSVYSAYESDSDVPMGSDRLAFSLVKLEQACKVLENRITGLKEDVTYRLKKGERVAGYHLEPSFGRLKWNDNDKTVIAVGQAIYGVDLSVTKAITPTQAKALLKDQATIDALSSRPTGAPKLVADKNLNLKRIFGESG